MVHPTGSALRRRPVRAVGAAVLAAAGFACGPEGPTAPLTSYPCQVGWSLLLVSRDPLQDYYYEALSEGTPTGSRASLVEAGDSLEVALNRIDVTLDPSGTGCIGVQSLVSAPWSLVAVDPAGSLSIRQPQGSTPAMVRAVSTGPIRVRAIVGRDTVGPAWVTVVPRVASLAITPSDTVDPGAVPVTVRVTGRDSLGQAVQTFVGRVGWAVLGTSTLPVAQWPSVSLAPRNSGPAIDAIVTFPTSAVTGTAKIKLTTRHTNATLTVTVPPAP